MTHKLTPALIRAMAAVRAGKVAQVCTGEGNVFRGPTGIAASCYRRLEVMRYIEDVPGQKRTGVFESRIVQQLSAAGQRALWDAGEPNAAHQQDEAK